MDRTLAADERVRAAIQRVPALPSDDTSELFDHYTCTVCQYVEVTWAGFLRHRERCRARYTRRYSEKEAA